MNKHFYKVKPLSDVTLFFPEMKCHNIVVLHAIRSIHTLLITLIYDKFKR